MSKKRDAMVQNFTGHVPPSDVEDVLASMAPVVVPPQQHRLTRNTLTPETVDQMRLRVAQGATIPVAAAAMGIPFNVWKHWGPAAKADQEMGKTPGWGPGESKYLMWAAAMQQAKAALESELIAQIIAHGADDWKALAWVAERRFPDRWYPKKNVEVTVKKDDVTQLSSSELLAIADKSED